MKKIEYITSRPSSFLKSLRHSQVNRRTVDVDLLKKSLKKRNLNPVSSLALRGREGKNADNTISSRANSEKYEKMKKEIDLRARKQIIPLIKQLKAFAHNNAKFHNLLPEDKRKSREQNTWAMDVKNLYFATTEKSNNTMTDPSFVTQRETCLEQKKKNSVPDKNPTCRSLQSSKTITTLIGSLDCPKTNKNTTKSTTTLPSVKVLEPNYVKIVNESQSIPESSTKASNTFRENYFKGMANNTYNTRLLNEKGMQVFILKDELKVLIEKIYKMKPILQKGINVKMSEMVKCMHHQTEYSLNLKLKKLCEYLYTLGNVLLQDLCSMKEKLGIPEIREELEKFIQEKACQKLAKHVQMLHTCFEHFRCCVYSFEILQRRDIRKGFNQNAMTEILRLISKSRFLVSNIYEEYVLEEKNVEAAIKEALITAQSKTTEEDIYSQKISKERLAHKFHETEEFKINTFIKKCLGKLVPHKHSEFSQMISPLKPWKFDMQHSLHNMQMLKSSINILKSSRPKPSIRAQVSTLLNELKVEYDNVQSARSSSVQHLYLSPASRFEEMQN